MCSAQPVYLKEKLAENQKANQSEIPKKSPCKDVKTRAADSAKENARETADEPKDAKEQRASPKASPTSAAKETNNNHEDIKLSKSIGNYTGLESLQSALRPSNNHDGSQIKCTCNCTCECELCLSMRAYQEAKRLGFDYTLTSPSVLSYLNHLHYLNHIHDVKDHNLEQNLELDNFEDLIRLLPDSRVMIAIVTFNMNGKHCDTASLHELLMPDALEYFPDIYVIGVQEFIRDSEEIHEWCVELQTTIGPTHVLLHDVSFGVLHLSLFVRRDLIFHVSVPEDDSMHCRYLQTSTNLIRTKGAVAISLKIFGTSFLFVNSHFPAHQHAREQRIDEYYRISTGLDLPRNLKSTLKRSYQSHDITNRFNCVFWFGDLNFRVDQDQETVLEEIALAKFEKDENDKHCFDSIFLHDQLSLSMKKGEVLTGFDEAEVNWQPTYKYLIGTNEYDEESTRIPSYTDRILYKNKRSGHITCKLYTSIQSVKSSDHKPLFGLFQCLIRPGVDDCPSNAGAFDRDVYVEGLKRLNVRRQAMKVDHPERPRGLIANLKARKWFHSSVN